MNTCPGCGKSLEAITPEGLCPACLIKQGLEDWPSTDGAGAATVTVADESEGVPDRIGPYRLIQSLGKGGMGEVWLAEQESPVRRKVALKLIKWGMDTKSVVARFEAERQALALMEHPNIAKVFDAGATDSGRPYFAMELVKGVPITQHCDRHRLNTQQRLGLFMQVCEGVQHAHQKGIIHRDIKPSNVLVTIEGDRAVPKIIDFGVAKATAQRLTEKSVFTEMGQLIGTPEYMSPEQADLTAQDIDTRSDVYSLGVLLYEMLAGALPFGSRELRQAGYDEIRRKIREDDPPKPSTRLSSLSGEQTAETAKARRTDLVHLRRQLQGDLDWITMKALEKDRTRRYGSPNEFAADVRRHLKHEPVLAGPPSAAYKTRKFVRRHRVGVGFAAVLLLVLIGFSAAITVQAGRLSRERDRANAEAERATSEAERANQEATTAKRTSEFMTRLFAIPDPGEERGKTITAKEILDRGADQIERGLLDEPLVRARLMATMGRTYSGLGLGDKSLALLEQALAIHEEQLGPENAEVANVLCNLAITHEWYGDADRFLSDAERCLAIRRAVLAPDDRDLALALAYVAWELERTDLEEAEKLGREARAVCQRNSLPMDWRCSEATIILSKVLAKAKTTDPEAIREARELTREAIEAYERAKREGGYWDPLAATLSEAGLNYAAAGAPDKGLGILLRSYEHAEQELGPGHFLTSIALAIRGLMLRELGRPAEARREFERALATLEISASPTDRRLRDQRTWLATTLLVLGEYEQALPLSQESLALADHSRTKLYSLLGLAYNHQRLEQFEQARTHYTRAIALYQKDLTNNPIPNHPSAIQLVYELATLVRDAGEDDDALQLFGIAAAASRAHRSSWGYYHDSYLRVRIHEDYAAQLRKLGDSAKASEQETRAEEFSAHARAREEALKAVDGL